MENPVGRTRLISIAALVAAATVTLAACSSSGGGSGSNDTTSNSNTTPATTSSSSSTPATNCPSGGTLSADGSSAQANAMTTWGTDFQAQWSGGRVNYPRPNPGQ